MEYLTKKEAARRLHVEVRTLDRYRSLGIIRAAKLRGKVLISTDEIDRVVKKSLEKRRQYTAAPS